jgi:hypothetical protein
VAAGPAVLKIPLAAGATVSGLLDLPDRPPKACYVFAHGAGAGMRHVFMDTMARGLATRGVATLRFQFPYMEQGGRRPDTPKVAQEAVRAAVQEASKRLPGTALFAGGKSYGGRMTSQAQAEQPLPQVRGIVFVGFPLHPAGKPGIERAAHLSGVQLPMLFLQGSRDALAAPDLVRQALESLGKSAKLHAVDGADHAFHVLVRSGRNDEQVREELLDTMAAWMTGLVSGD